MSVAYGGALPQVDVTWKGEGGALSVVAPDGFEISPDAPADVSVRWADRQVTYAVSGDRIVGGIDLWAVRGERVEGDLKVTLCDKADGVCEQLALAVRGDIPEEKKGSVDLQVAVPEAEPTHSTEGPAFHTDAQALADAAFSAVKGTDRRVLLDFSAVWCPPCNQLAAEVLHAENPPAILDEYEIVVLDADDARSWALKDRYHVGGYPTVVVADAKGREISREVGFSGREDFVRWLTDTARETEPAIDYTEVDPTTIAAPEAGLIAWNLAKQREKGADIWIARAEEAEPTLELRLARALTAPTIEDASWLADNAPDRTLDWLPGASKLSSEDGGTEVLELAISRALVDAEGEKASDLLYFSAIIADDDPLLYAASASALRAGFTGEPFRDRALYTSLAGLLEKSGDVPGALSFLHGVQESFPDEPTFLLKEAGIHLRAEDFEMALKTGEACVEAGWGDNRLRCAALVCEALVGLDRSADAAKRAEAVLAEIAAPAEGLDVRAPRYRKKLQAFADGG